MVLMVMGTHGNDEVRKWGSFSNCRQLHNARLNSKSFQKQDDANSFWTKWLQRPSSLSTSVRTSLLGNWGFLGIVIGFLNMQSLKYKEATMNL